MKDDKKKITTTGLARLIAIAGEQEKEGIYEIVDGIYIDVRVETMSVHLNEQAYILCDEMNLRVDIEHGEIIVHLWLKGEHIGLCNFWF